MADQFASTPVNFTDTDIQEKTPMNRLRVPQIAAMTGSKPVWKVIDPSQPSRSNVAVLIAPWGCNIANRTYGELIRESKQHLHLIFSHSRARFVRSSVECEASTDFLLSVTARYLKGDLGSQSEMIRALEKAKQQLRDRKSSMQEETKQKEQDAKEVEQDPVGAVIRFLISLFA